MRTAACLGTMIGVALAAAPAAADTLDFKGSLGPAGGHTRYVAPIANPLFNETPYITTELRLIYLHNEIPSSFATGGGRIDAGAAELRVALTDRLGIIASKDGYVDADFNGVFPHERGFENISLGAKYAVISDPAAQGILTVGVEYEPPTGSLRAGPIRLQGGASDGFIDVFVTGAKAWGKLGLQASLGHNFAIDSDQDSSLLHYSAHVDYEVLPRFFPMVELNGFTVTKHGRRTAADFEGVDLVNFGSTGGGTIVTAAAGARYRFTDNVQLGIAYERPVTQREDLLGWRVYADLVLSF